MLLWSELKIIFHTSFIKLDLRNVDKIRNLKLQPSLKDLSIKTDSVKKVGIFYMLNTDIVLNADTTSYGGTCRNNEDHGHIWSYNTVRKYQNFLVSK